MPSPENRITDIFTDLDDAIFSDGSIDPMGLRIIWTALGGQIFGNRLNTISTDIRLYTLNLFNHYLIYSYEKSHPEKFRNLEGRPPYNNLRDIYDGLVVFLECLMTHALLNKREELEDSDVALVPGINKLRQLMEAKDKRALYLIVNRYPGILERHHLLGIHGRHKGPFREMKLFSEKAYYSNRAAWDETAKLFAVSPWRDLAVQILNGFDQIVFLSKHRPLNVKPEKVVSTAIIDGYTRCLQPEVFRQRSLVEFWEKHLGLLAGEAAVFYDLIKTADESATWQSLINMADAKLKPNPEAVTHAIVAVEPLLTCIHKVANRLLHRATTEIGAGEKDFLSTWQKQSSINISKIEEILRSKVLQGDAHGRLSRLVAIYKAAEPEQFAKLLIAYHKEIMESRGNMPWLAIADNEQIVHHRSLYFTDEELSDQVGTGWVNNYYLKTVNDLYKGLYGVA